MKTLPEENNGKWIIYIKYLDKMPVPGSPRTFWRTEVRVKERGKEAAPF
jgi:hypothetical protein